MGKKSHVHLDDEGRVWLPDEILKEVGIQLNDFVRIEVLGDGQLSIRKCKGSEEIDGQCVMELAPVVAEEDERYGRKA